MLTQAEEARFNYNQVHIAAAPFVFPSDEASGRKHILLSTPALRYWVNLRDNGLFITHLRWKEGRTQHELSRCKIVDIWIKAFNLTKKLFEIRDLIKEHYGMGPLEDQLPDEEENQQYRTIVFHVFEIQTLHAYLSTFLASLVPIEAIGRVRYEWDCSYFPRVPSTRLSYLDPDLPSSTEAFQLIRSLDRLVNEAGDLSDLAYFMIKLDQPLADEFPPSSGRWRTRIQQIAVDPRTVLDLAGERSLGSGKGVQGTKRYSAEYFRQVQQANITNVLRPLHIPIMPALESPAGEDEEAEMTDSDAVMDSSEDEDDYQGMLGDSVPLIPHRKPVDDATMRVTRRKPRLYDDSVN